MDVDRARAYQGRQYQGRVAALSEPGGLRTYQPRGERNTGGLQRGACFECGQMGHFTRNCPRKPRRTNINLINLQEEGPSDDEVMPPMRGRVASVKDQLTQMTDKEQEQLAKEMGVAEDFPTA